MFLDGLDDLDQKIIRCLIQNARMSYSEIGQQVGISRVAVKMRVQALEKKGIIEEYTTIINPQKISGAISCYFEIETVPDTLEEVIGIRPSNGSLAEYGVSKRQDDQQEDGSIAKAIDYIAIGIILNLNHCIDQIDHDHSQSQDRCK